MGDHPLSQRARGLRATSFNFRAMCDMQRAGRGRSTLFARTWSGRDLPPVADQSASGLAFSGLGACRRGGVRGSPRLEQPVGHAGCDRTIRGEELPRRSVLHGRLRLQPPEQRRSDPVPGTARPLAQPHVHRQPERGRFDDTGFATWRSTTTCDLEHDASTYWVPTVYLGQEPITPLAAVVYYTKRTSGPVTTPPLGLKMLAGNPNAHHRQAKGDRVVELRRRRWHAALQRRSRSARPTTPWS